MSTEARTSSIFQMPGTRARGLWIGVLLVVFSAQLAAHSSSAATTPGTHDTLQQRGGQHDFDFEIGTWKTKLTRLKHPLSGSDDWVECDGTSVVRKVWNGRANLLELEVDCPGGHLEALSLRLYNPRSHQWSLNFAGSSSGSFSTPTIGEFKNGRGEFFDEETFAGKPVYVKFVIYDITPNSCHFDQYFSPDGGKTWELNWRAVDTRIEETDALQPAREPDRSSDFDFEVGSWNPHIARLQHPLTASGTWVEYQGKTLIQKVWNGRANLVQLEASGPAGQLEVLCLRLYNPQTHQWSLNYANSAEAVLTPPVIGEFKNGRGEFYGQDEVGGRMVFVRNVISEINPKANHFEQAFSDDGAKTWQINFRETLTRVNDEPNQTH